MASTFKATFSTRMFNKIITTLLKLGFNLGNMTLLTVRGRKSGQPRTTPVSLIEHNGQRWLSSPYGQSEWVRNLRAAGEATITRGRRREHVIAVELDAKEAAPVLKHILAIAPDFIRVYFDVKPDSPIEDFEREAPRHPVFLLKSASEQERLYSVEVLSGSYTNPKQ